MERTPTTAFAPSTRVVRLYHGNNRIAHALSPTNAPGATAQRPQTRMMSGGQTSRRVFTRTCALSALSGLVLASRSGAASANLMPLDEAVSVLSSVRDNMDTWLALSTGEDIPSLRRALRAGAASRLRVAALAIPQLCPFDKQAAAADARRRAIKAVEAADLAALRASRQQAPDAPVAKHLNELSDAIDALLSTVGVEPSR